MNMARSTFYKRPHAGHRAAREKADTDLRVRIEDILAEFPAYGYRRVTHELRRRRLVINHKRVARVMREHALTPPPGTRMGSLRRTAITSGPSTPNLRSSITPEGPDELWVADLTYIRLTTGFVFLAVVLDAWSRRVIGYAISHLLDTRLCLAALDAALDLRQPRAGLVHHSDRGVQYASRAYGSRLAAHGIRGSMSRRGNPYDNAHVESFFKTLKHEEIFANDYSTIDDLTTDSPTSLRRYTIEDACTPPSATGRLRNSRVCMQPETLNRSIQPTPHCPPRGSLQLLCNFGPPLTLKAVGQVFHRPRGCTCRFHLSIETTHPRRA